MLRGDAAFRQDLANKMSAILCCTLSTSFTNESIGAGACEQVFGHLTSVACAAAVLAASEVRLPGAKHAPKTTRALAFGELARTLLPVGEMPFRGKCSVERFAAFASACETGKALLVCAMPFAALVMFALHYAIRQPYLPKDAPREPVPLGKTNLDTLARVVSCLVTDELYIQHVAELYIAGLQELQERVCEFVGLAPYDTGE